MSKRLDQMRRNPQNDWTIRDVEIVCTEFGVACRPPRSGGSHYKISHAMVEEILTLPFKRPIKPVYIRKLVAMIDTVRNIMGRLEYAVIVAPLSHEEGGGFLATVPDLPGCMSDGETPEEAIANVQDAIAAWIEAAQEMGRQVPHPSSYAASA